MQQQQEQDKKPKKFMYASITQGREQCSINNMVSVIRMQGALLQQPVQLEFRFETTLGDAIDSFYKAKDFDVLIAVDNVMSFPDDFVISNALSEDPEKEIVTGVYPIPGELDWERVRAKANDTSEPNAFKANKYSLDLAKAEFQGMEWAKVTSCKLDCLIIKRAAIDAIAKAHPDRVHDAGLLVHVESLSDGKRRTKDETFCDLYGKPLWADLAHPCSSFGSYTFCGVVGLRRVLR